MSKYEEKISDNSIWLTATPTPLAQTLPFYISEAGYFIADCNYETKRSMHDSFLLLYTVEGNGMVRTGDAAMQLPLRQAVIIDCHIPHEYCSYSGTWNFQWIHFHGSGAAPLFDILYPDNAVRPIDMKNFPDFENRLSVLINKVNRTDVAGCITISSDMHSLFNSVCMSALENDNVSIKKEPADDIQAVVNFIENNYSNAISIDDMVNNIHVSKYHFIRRFRRAMGITPYSYLTNYRINRSKTLLRTTDKTVSQIAETCGFLDTSNFIAQFKKHTGQKPLQYRRDFS